MTVDIGNLAFSNPLPSFAELERIERRLIALDSAMGVRVLRAWQDDIEQRLTRLETARAATILDRVQAAPIHIRKYRDGQKTKLLRAEFGDSPVKPLRISDRNWEMFLAVLNGASLPKVGAEYGVSASRAAGIVTKVSQYIRNPPSPRPPRVTKTALAAAEFPEIPAADGQALYRAGLRRATVGLATDAELRACGWISWEAVARIRKAY